MPRLRPRLALVAAALAPAAVSCSSSATDPARNTGTPALTASEAGTVATGLLTQASAVAAGGSGVTRNGDGSYTVQCPGGGAVTGAVQLGDFTTNSDGSRNVFTTATITPQRCVVGTGARQIAITGDPSEVVRSTLTVAGTALLKSTSAVTGGFTWNGGSCQLNYTATTSLSGSTQTVTVTGTVCGQSVNRTATF